MKNWKKLSEEKPLPMVPVLMLELGKWPPFIGYWDENAKMGLVYSLDHFEGGRVRIPNQENIVWIEIPD